MSQPSQPENRKSKRKLPAAAEPFKFKPGQSGNPGGRPKKLPITDLYTEILNDQQVVDSIRKSVVGMITGGRMAGQLQLKEMAERVEGKVTQPVKGELEVTLTLSERFQRAMDRVDGGSGE